MTYVPYKRIEALRTRERECPGDEDAEGQHKGQSKGLNTRANTSVGDAQESNNEYIFLLMIYEINKSYKNCGNES